MFNYYMKPVLHFISFSPTLFKANMHSQTVRKRVFCVWFFNVFSLQNCIGFATHQHASAMGVHVFPILNPPSHLPPHTIPLDHPSTPAPSFLYPALNLDWRFVSYMILYMVLCHSPKSSPPLSHRVQKTKPIIQSEVSQKEKHQYSILMHIYGI